jgi:hypothetical protein
MPPPHSKSALAKPKKQWQTIAHRQLFFGVNVERIEF